MCNKPISQPEAFDQQERAGMLPGQGQARMLNEEEQRIREFIIRQSWGAQNIAPGSPLYDRVMGTNLSQPHSISPQPLPAGESLLKAILRQAFYFLCVMLAVAVGWAVFA